MNFRSADRRRSFAKHRAVTVTLVAWVFALMAGIANACVPHDRDPGRDGQAQERNASTVDAGGHKVACTDLRDSAASTAAKPVGQDSTDWGSAAVQSSAWCLNLAPDAVANRSLDDGVLAHGPPGAIRFLRLRL